MRAATHHTHWSDGPVRHLPQHGAGRGREPPAGPEAGNAPGLPRHRGGTRARRWPPPHGPRRQHGAGRRECWARASARAPEKPTPPPAAVRLAAHGGGGTPRAPRARVVHLRRQPRLLRSLCVSQRDRSHRRGSAGPRRPCPPSPARCRGLPPPAWPWAGVSAARVCALGPAPGPRSGHAGWASSTSGTDASVEGQTAPGRGFAGPGASVLGTSSPAARPSHRGYGGGGRSTRLRLHGRPAPGTPHALRALSPRGEEAASFAQAWTQAE